MALTVYTNSRGARRTETTELAVAYVSLSLPPKDCFEINSEPSLAVLRNIYVRLQAFVIPDALCQLYKGICIHNSTIPRRLRITRQSIPI